MIKVISVGKCGEDMRYMRLWIKYQSCKDEICFVVKKHLKSRKMLGNFTQKKHQLNVQII